MQEETKLTKKYGLITAIGMVIGIVIGSGVFFKAQDILKKTDGDMPLGILAWLIGGTVMMFCILAFSVMAQKYQKVNGIVDYAEATVGNKYSYFVGWFVTTVYFPGMTSALAWLTARYLLVFVCSVNPSLKIDPVAGPECMALAGFFLILVYALNALSPKLAGKLQVSTTIIKLIPLVLMAIVGTIYGFVNTNDATGNAVLVDSFATAKGDMSTLFGAVVATCFAYEGWIIATSINAEIKNAKKNLPIALVVGGIVIVAVYIFYYIGIAGGSESIEVLKNDGATKAFVNIFGGTFGNILNLFVAISCLGTLNGLTVGSSRALYSVSSRGYGPCHKIFGEVDKETNMPANSAVFGLVACSAWLVYFFGANLTSNWFGVFGFDSTELPIITVYAFYIPIFIKFMIKEKDLSVGKRFILPGLALLGSVFMVLAAIYAHGVVPYLAAKAEGRFSFPVLFYLIIFAVIMVIGALFMKKKEVVED